MLIKQEIINYFIVKLGKSEKIAYEMYAKLARHDDILKEFYNYTKTGNYCNEEGKKVSVEGYTAEQLVDKTFLKPIGAYNYLIYLREDPKNAIYDLQKGLPRR